jgi:hypothetical protein
MPAHSDHINDLAARLKALSSEQLLALLDEVEGLAERAKKISEERVHAEAERDAHALTCGCGLPVTRYRCLQAAEYSVRLGIAREGHGQPLRGGYICDLDTVDAFETIPANDPAYRVVWFKCDERNCDQWVAVPDGQSTHIAGCEY